MTENKPIMIDGIDVSGCEAYKYEHCKDKTSIMFCNTNLCSNFPNCNFKQLSRKTQECEELKNERTVDLVKQLDQLKAENEEYKKNGIDLFEQLSNGLKANEKLKAQNEQLKEELSAIQHNCNREGCKYYDDNTFKVFYECKAQKALQLSANSVTTKYCDLLKTLTEIKEIMKKHCRKCKKHKSYYFKLCCTCKYADILQKISEVIK